MGSVFRSAFVAVFSAAASAASSASAATITMAQPSQVGSAAQPNGIQPGDYAVPSSLPFVQQIVATSGTASGTNRFAEAASSFDFTQQRFITMASHDRDFGGYTLTQTDVLFTPDADVGYSLTGSSTAAEGSRFHSLHVRLRQGQFGPVLFESTQSYGSGSIAPALTAPQTFTLGQGGTVTGIPSGVLTGGTTYSLFIAMEGRAADDLQSSGAGSVTLSVPEPGSFVSLAGGGAMLLARRRRS